MTLGAPIGVRLMSKLIIRASAVSSMGSLAARYFYRLVPLQLTGSRLIRIPLGRTAIGSDSFRPDVQLESAAVIKGDANQRNHFTEFGGRCILK